MRLTLLSSQITAGRIGIDYGLGHYEIKSKPADLEISTTPSQMNSTLRFPVMSIDMSSANDALYGGKIGDLLKRINSQLPNQVQERISGMVDKWEAIGDIRDPGNPIPRLAKKAMSESPPKPDIYGPPSSDNIDISFDLTEPNVQIVPGEADVRAKMNKPDISYYRGQLNIYLQTKPTIDFDVTRMDIRI